jgi:hypothetical protein
VAAVVVAAAGCGGGDGKPSDETAARDTVTAFTKAFAAMDGDKACALLTPQAAAAFVERARVATGSIRCPETMQRVAQLAGSSVTDPLSKATVGEVKVTGNTATTTLTASGHSTPVTLSKADGDWKLNGVPGVP